MALGLGMWQSPLSWDIREPIRFLVGLFWPVTQDPSMLWSLKLSREGYT